MTDSNKTRAKRSKEWARNKAAFDEVIGDPFSPDIVDGVYNLLHHSSNLSSIEGKLGEAKATTYAAKPTILDFFCDVDNTIRFIVADDFLRGRFYLTYVWMKTEHKMTLPRDVRNKLEQLIGKALVVRGISPVKRYFTVEKHR